MIATLSIIALAFYWLLLETDYLRVRLLVGVLMPAKPNRKWQFDQYGDDALMLSDRCYTKHCKECKKDADQFYTWRIPARTVQFYGSVINFKEGCNLYRAKLLRDILRAQKRRSNPAYKPTTTPPRGHEQPFGDIEIKVDGEVKLSLNGGSKPGMVKVFMNQYR